MLPGMNNAPLRNTSPMNVDDVEIIDKLDSFEIWFSMTWKWLVRISVAIIAVAIIFFSINAWVKSSREATEQKIFSVLADTNLSTEDKLTQLGSLINENPDATVTAYARFFIAKNNVDSAKYDEAIIQYTAIENSKKVDPFAKNRALLSRGNVLEIQGKIPEAMVVYQGVFEPAVDAQSIEDDMILTNAMQIEAAYALARLQFKQADYTAAQLTLDNLRNTVASTPNSIYYYTPYAQMVERLQDDLNIKNPPAPIGADLSKMMNFVNVDSKK